MPRPVRYLLDGLGTPNAQSAHLLDIGYQDAHAHIDGIEAFVRA